MVTGGKQLIDAALVDFALRHSIDSQFSSSLLPFSVQSRGIYFADKSSYSNSYSYKPAFRPQHLTIEDGRPVGSGDEHELFLTKLLIGKQVHMNRDESSQKANECRALTVPPVNPRSSLKYNTVAGETGGSKVWIVYENGRAYPDYLVRYYRGKRDPKRTPYQNQTDALNKERTFGRQSGIASSSLNTEINLTRDFVDADSTGSGGVGVIWEFWDNSGWKDYNAAHQRKLEAGYKLFSAMGTGTGSANTNTQCIHIQSDTWFYRVDLKEMKQTNIENQSKTQRDVRRRIVSSPSLATVSADDTCC